MMFARQDTRAVAFTRPVIFEKLYAMWADIWRSRVALYINSHEVAALYRRPQLRWLARSILLHWISRIWLLASRGKIDD